MGRTSLCFPSDPHLVKEIDDSINKGIQTEENLRESEKDLYICNSLKEK